MAFFDEHVGVLAVHGFAFALAVGAMGTAHVHAFVEFDAAPGQRLNDKLLGTRHKARLIRVFNT